jgi:hypothetical protein
MTGQPQFERWFKIDLPVLRAVVTLSNEGVEYIDPAEIATRAGLEKTTVARSLLALAHDDPAYFEAPGAHGGNPQVVAVHSVTGHARRVAGDWPSPESYAEVLVEQIMNGLREIAEEEPDKEKRSKAAWFLDGGRDMLTNVIAAVVAKQMGA